MIFASATALTTIAAGVFLPAAAPVPAALPTQCTGSAPIVCHYNVAPGNYDITAAIGAAGSAGNTSITVEARRQISPAIATPAGTVRTFTATVNVRDPEGQPTGQGGTGTPGLTITFGGSAPRVDALTVVAAVAPRQVFLAGDSTVCDQPTAPYTGWGQILPAAVKAGAVIANYADSGESSGSFLSNSALMPRMEPLIKKDDLVFIQFGHNDKNTSASAFRQNLTTMVNRVRGRGGLPVLVTPPVRRLFSGNQLTPTALHVNGLGVNLPVEMRSVASANNVPLIDLTASSEALVESLGPSASSQLYLTTAANGVNDNTHFSETGAGRMSGLVVQGIRDRNLPLVPFLR